MSLLDWFKSADIKWRIAVLIMAIVVIVISLVVLENLILKFLSHVDEQKNYSREKLISRIQEREDRQRNYFYYGIDYWKWQSKKEKILRELFPIGTVLVDGRTVTNVQSFDKLVDKEFSYGKRNTRYKRELRYIVGLVSKSGDTIQGDKISGSKFVNSGSGTQINYVTKNTVVNSLESLLASGSLNDRDSYLVRQFVSELLQDRSTENTKQTVIDTLSNYIGIISGIASVIDVLHNFQIL